MSKWLFRKAEQLNTSLLSKSEEEMTGLQYLRFPEDYQNYITQVGETQIGMAESSTLERVIRELNEIYPSGFDRAIIQIKPIPTVSEPIDRRKGFDQRFADMIVLKLRQKNKPRFTSPIDQKIRKQQKNYMPAAPHPRGWELGGGTVSEQAYEAVNRPEENFERTKA